MSNMHHSVTVISNGVNFGVSGPNFVEFLHNL